MVMVTQKVLQCFPQRDAWFEISLQLRGSEGVYADQGSGKTQEVQCPSNQDAFQQKVLIHIMNLPISKELSNHTRGQGEASNFRSPLVTRISLQACEIPKLGCKTGIGAPNNYSFVP